MRCGIGSWGGSASENGRLRHGDGGPEGGDRHRRVLVLPTLPADRKAMGKGAAVRAMLGPYGRKRGGQGCWTSARRGGSVPIPAPARAMC